MVADPEVMAALDEVERVLRHEGAGPVEEVDVENGARLLDDDDSALHDLRHAVEVQIWQARLRKERVIHSQRRDAWQQRSDGDGAVVALAVRWPGLPTNGPFSQTAVLR